MPTYRVTKEAGPRIAGLPNPGEGVEITLTERAAAHDLRVGAIELIKPPIAKPVGKRKGGSSA